jgi:hypothetical protein
LAFGWEQPEWTLPPGWEDCAVLKVLIAEDDFMIADLAEMLLVGNGYKVCGIARTVADATNFKHLKLQAMPRFSGGFALVNLLAPIFT